MVCTILSGFGLLEFDFFSQTTGSRIFLPFGLLRIFTLRFARGVGGETVDEGNDNLLDVDFRVQLGCGRKERAEGVEMEFIRKNLKNEVWLSRRYQ
jgi:hypothetical protein